MCSVTQSLLSVPEEQNAFSYTLESFTTGEDGEMWGDSWEEGEKRGNVIKIKDKGIQKVTYLMSPKIKSKPVGTQVLDHIEWRWYDGDDGLVGMLKMTYDAHERLTRYLKRESLKAKHTPRISLWAPFHFVSLLSPQASARSPGPSCGRTVHTLTGYMGWGMARTELTVRLSGLCTDQHCRVRQQKGNLDWTPPQRKQAVSTLGFSGGKRDCTESEWGICTRPFLKHLARKYLSFITLSEDSQGQNSFLLFYSFPFIIPFLFDLPFLPGRSMLTMIFDS